MQDKTKTFNMHLFGVSETRRCVERQCFRITQAFLDNESRAHTFHSETEEHPTHSEDTESSQRGKIGHYKIVPGNY